MKDFLIKSIVIILFLIILAPRVWGQPDAGDRWQDAMPLELNISHTETIGEVIEETRDGQDWFAVTLTLYGEVRFTLSAPGFTAILIVYGADNHNNGIGVVQVSDETRTVSSFFKPGIYHINVRSPTPSNGTYTLTTAQVPEAQPTLTNEGDDTWAEAHPISVGTTLVGNIGYYDTTKAIDYHDWYKINVTQYGLVHVQLTAQGVKSQFSVFGNKSLYPGYAAIQSASVTDYENPNNTQIISLYLRPGTYYVDVIKYYQTPNVGIYTMAVTQDPEVQPTIINEADDTFQTANSIGLDDVISGNIGYYADDWSIDYHDWYKVVIPTYGQVHLELESPFIFASFSVYGDKDQYPPLGVLAKEDALDYPSAGNAAVIALYLMPGSYFIDVGRYASKPNARPYTLTVYQDPEPQPSFTSELDNEWSEALPVLSNRLYIGNIGYYNIVYDIDFQDWYAIQLPSSTGVTVTVSALRFDTIMRVYKDPPGAPIYSVNVEDETITFPLPEGVPANLTIEVLREEPAHHPKEGVYTFSVDALGTLNPALPPILQLLLFP